MTYLGTVRDGVVILPAGTTLANGQVVRVAVAEGPLQQSSPEEQFVSSMQQGANLPDDLALNLDYYLHGLSRKPAPRTHRWLEAFQTDELNAEQLADEACQLAALAAETRNLPPDLAVQHNHYLHGLPKR